jgi:hypothetical protein
MAFYRDPLSGERILVDEPHAPVRSSTGMLTFIVLVALLIVGGSMLYHYIDLWSNERTAQSTIDHPPVASPNLPTDPNSSRVPRTTAP